MPKGKAPAFQFYVKDWLSAPDLRMCSCSTRGIWIDLLCFMWESRDRGEVEGTMREFVRLCSCTESEFTLFTEEAKRYGFCDISVTDNGSITVVNRRMSREEKLKKDNRLRQQRFRDNAKVTPKSNKKVTPPSSTATASAKKKTSKKKDTFYPDWLDKNLWKEFKKMRVKIKKPMTEFAEKKAIKRLKEIMDKGFSQEDVVSVSIEKCWQTFYEPHEQLMHKDDESQFDKDLAKIRKDRDEKKANVSK
jgi:hypothetical protein